jgi:hypothetical protein
MAKADLIKKAQELGLELTGEETIPQLEALIASTPKPDVEENTQTQEETIPHVVTEEDAQNNPELADNGITIGDEIGIPVTELGESETVPEQPPIDNDHIEEGSERFAEESKEQNSYYVWNAEGQFYKFFTVAEHGADAEKKAKALAEEIGGTVS